MQIKVHVNWIGPLTIEDLKRRKDDETETQIGLYQIYGNHPVYGQNVLLYIGQTSNQSFYTRNSQKGDILFFQYIEELKFHVGTVKLSEESTSSRLPNEQILKRCEALLIFVHQPAGNSEGLQSLDKSVGDLRIYNWDNYGRLLPEVSSERWTDKYWINKNIIYRDIN